jgi:hypothetical protein
VEWRVRGAATREWSREDVRGMHFDEKSHHRIEEKDILTLSYCRHLMASRDRGIL